MLSHPIVATSGHPAPVARGWTNLQAWLPVLNYSSALLIIAVDWMVPAGIVVGIFLTIPILMASARDHPRHVLLVSLVAIVGFVLAAHYGRGPISPAAAWIPNRVMASLTIPASTAISLLLQRRRLEAVQARDRAISASEINRLLMSLLAHDLRAPLAVADQALQYVETAVSGGKPLDPQLVVDVRARMQRSLRAVDVVLGAARGGTVDPKWPGQGEHLGSERVRAEISSEVDSFRREAAARRKSLRVSFLGIGGWTVQLDPLVLRQAVAILVDNAIRYARPGEVHVYVEAGGEELTVVVEDAGPAPSRRSESGGSGSGLGLELCSMLVERSGGTLEVQRGDSGSTRLLLKLPLAPAGWLARAPLKVAGPAAAIA